MYRQFIVTFTSETEVWAKSEEDAIAIASEVDLEGGFTAKEVPTGAEVELEEDRP